MIWDLEKFCQFVFARRWARRRPWLFVFAGTCPEMFGEKNDLELRKFFRIFFFQDLELPSCLSRFGTDLEIFLSIPPNT